MSKKKLKKQVKKLKRECYSLELQMRLMAYQAATQIKSYEALLDYKVKQEDFEINGKGKLQGSGY